KVLGYNILLDSPAVIDVSGYQGGGNIYIGGDYLGKGPLPNANAGVMAPYGNLYADALQTGDGGEVILWSDNYTRAAGNIYARGGALSGDGGFVETSSKNVLDAVGARVNLTAAHGEMGLWLLDPRNVTINAISTSNPSDFNG